MVNSSDTVLILPSLQAKALCLLFAPTLWENLLFFLFRLLSTGLVASAYPSIQFRKFNNPVDGLTVLVLL